MLERDAESAAGDTDPRPAGKEPVTKGGGKSGATCGWVGGILQELGLKESHFEGISG